MRGKRPDHIPEKSWNRICDGVGFDEERQPHYTAHGGGNEISLDNGMRLDSYVPTEEIVSRKETQLAEIQESTAIGYLRELSRKYSPGKTIKDTPHNRAQLPEEVGEKIDGALVLEVPPQTKDVPATVLNEAARLGIKIRDENGKVYRPS